MVCHRQKTGILPLLYPHDADLIFGPEIYLPDSPACPFGRYRNLKNRILVVDLNIIIYMVCTKAHRFLFRNIPFRIDHFIRTVPKKELSLNIPGGLADYVFRSILLKQGCNLQAALEIGSDAHKANVKVSNPDAF